VSLRINFQGLGFIETVSNGTRIEGTAFIYDNLYAKQISSSPSSSGLNLISDKTVSLSMLETVTRDNLTETQSVKARVRVKPNMEMISDSLTITDTMGDEVFGVDGDGVRVGKNKLVAHSASIDTALQTSQVKSRAGEPLYIHSPTSYLKLEGNTGLDLSATSDNLNIRSLNNIDINSRRGKVVIKTKSLFLPQLPVYNSSDDQADSSRRQYSGGRFSTGLIDSVYQVCVCDSGRLFLVLPSAPCVASKEICKS